ncbi:cupin domain-containing protein [Flavobacterium luteum]|uniref:Cupin domain-containing protein n=1 Tax=Flavobacterium luteum TaxID=2026654 RepID=A0A7J5AJM5_9FLAO|nr:cupin domain-containing protein [Flavobacterium luteum]KAB1157776.1 cupin domain-containing protein [Flavobacterium luteum]
MIQLGNVIENQRTRQRMIFLKTGIETKGEQLQIECFSPVTSAKDSEHIHPFQENRFQIISGELIFYINRKEQRAIKGNIVSIPKNVPHYFRNPGPNEAHYIQEFCPALKIDSLFETFFALAREGKLNEKGAPNIFRLSLIMLKHEKEFRLTKPNWIIQKIIFKLIAPFGKFLGYKEAYNY